MSNGHPGLPKRKQVVTALVQKPEDGSILLVKRSQKVSTYQDQWGGVSGGIEGHESPIHRCLQEVSGSIAEEVGFGAEDVAFVRSGRPLYVDDGRRRFAVHPFLFHLTKPQGQVQLNWENVDSAWVDPRSIRSKNTVPLLPETYERVAVPPELLPALDNIVADRSHGAAQLAVWVLDALKDAAQQLNRQGSPEAGGTPALEALRNYGYHLATARPSMAPLANVAAAVLSEVHRELASRAEAFEVTQGQVCTAAVKATQSQRERLAAVGQQLQSHARELLKDGMTVITTSYSSTIAQALCQAAKDGCRLKAIVCESRPLNEGVSLANTLAAAGVQCTVITDAQAGLFVQQADLVLVGADSITQQEAVNKAGTYLIALAAQAHRVPLFVIADTTKFCPGALIDLAHPGDHPLAAAHEEKGPEEVSASWQVALQPGVAVRNIYFEGTPLNLVSGIVTEDGVLHPSQIGSHVDHLRQMYSEAFAIEAIT
ncbi:hypothetical protein N2152v2_006948 [Parachlorella kessleri]